MSDKPVSQHYVPQFYLNILLFLILVFETVGEYLKLI